MNPGQLEGRFEIRLRIRVDGEFLQALQSHGRSLRGDTSAALGDEQGVPDFQVPHLRTERSAVHDAPTRGICPRILLVMEQLGDGNGCVENESAQYRCPS